MRAMPRWRKRAAEPKKGDGFAHIVYPASKLEEAVVKGEAVQARCGASITGAAYANAPLCQTCVVEQLRIDDTAAAEQATKRYEAGVTDGRQKHADEVAREAAAQARRERELLEAPRFEVVDTGRAVRFTFEDGTTATVRRDHIGSVVLDQNNGLHRVVVDGYVLIANADLELVRRHHSRVHDVAFGSRVPA